MPTNKKHADVNVSAEAALALENILTGKGKKMKQLVAERLRFARDEVFSIVGTQHTEFGVGNTFSHLYKRYGLQTFVPEPNHLLEVQKIYLIADDSMVYDGE